MGMSRTLSPLSVLLLSSGGIGCVGFIDYLLAEAILHGVVGDARGCFASAAGGPRPTGVSHATRIHPTAPITSEAVLTMNNTGSSMVFRIIALFVLFVGLWFSPGESPMADEAPSIVTPKPVQRPVFHLSGGTIDDAAASILLSTMDAVRLEGIQISNSDTLYQFAMQNQWKIHQVIGRPQISLGLSQARGFNAFPWQYRNDAYLIANSSIIGSIPDRDDWPPYPSGDRLLKQRLTRALDTNQPIVIVATAPLTPLVDVLKGSPQLKGAIKELIWMGGAIDVPGNLDPDTIPEAIANPKAEWNAFWDPYAIDWIFRNTRFPITLFPLDVTDEAKVTQAFLRGLSDQSKRYRYSALVGSLYALVEDQPYFEMWNTLATSYVGQPGIFETPVPLRLAIETEGYWQGTIRRGDATDRAVNVVMKMKDPDRFYAYVLKQLRRN